MRYSLKFIFKHLRDLSRTDIYSAVFTFPITVLLTWFVLNYSKLTANQITIAGLTIGISGSILVVLGIEYTIIGYCIFYILDWVDGFVAAAKGGTKKGMMLDYITDRFVFIAVVLSLIYFHFQRTEMLEMLLVSYFGFYYLVFDVLGQSIVEANYKFRIYNEKARSEINNKNIANFSRIWNWFPTRLSVVYFMLITYFFTDSFIMVYYVALIVLTLNISKIILQKINKIKDARTDSSSRNGAEA